MKKTCIIACLLSILNMLAQNYAEYYFNDLPKTPKTAEFIRFGKLNNNEYNGSNSPEINLFNINEGDINIDIALKYFSGNGIKANEEASCVGLGWGIPMATIVQTVSGGYDDLSPINKLNLDFLYDSTPPNIRNSFKVCENSTIPSQYLNQLAKDKFTFFNSMRAMFPVGGLFKNYNNSIGYDTAPDIFICNLFGEKLELLTSNFRTNNYNESFIPQFECLNKKGYKIEYNTSDLFIITSPKGIKFYFSKAEEYGNGANGGSNGTTLVTTKGRNFVITKIIDKRNRIINIDYFENNNIKLINDYSQRLNLTVSIESKLIQDNYFPPNSFYNGECFPSSGYGDQQYDLGTPSTGGSSPLDASGVLGGFAVPSSFSSTLFHKNQLLVKSINGDFGNVMFEYSTRDDFTNKKLDRIILKNTSTRNIKKIDFNYSYFNSQITKTRRTEFNNLNILNVNQDIPIDYFVGSPFSVRIKSSNFC